MILRVLDACCGAGGLSRGYYDGFMASGLFDDVEVTGVDIVPQKHYPYRFIQEDVLTFPLTAFDFVHVSAPCQAFSKSSRRYKNAGKPYPELIVPMRERLIDSGIPYVFENVVGAPLLNPTQLCGTNFGLKVYRHRLFESSIPLPKMGCKHPRHLEDGYVCIYGGRVRGKQTGNVGNNYTSYSVETGRKAMGIDWMNGKELSQAVPPAYSHWIASQIVEELYGQNNQDSQAA